MYIYGWSLGRCGNGNARLGMPLKNILFHLVFIRVRSGDENVCSAGLINTVLTDGAGLQSLRDNHFSSGGWGLSYRDIIFELMARDIINYDATCRLVYPPI